jgi:DNA polymerase-3 subunit chi
VPRVDFYILPDAAPEGRRLWVCRLIEKACGIGHRVFVLTESYGQAQLLDDQLWTFRQGSFVPHALLPAPPEDESPVLIGWEPAPAVIADVLINLQAEVPADFKRFQRVAEVVNQDPPILAASRERFRFYRSRGCMPETHKL